MNKAEQYARKYLAREVEEVEGSSRINHLTNLTVYEKAAILKYTHDGYEELNESLRKSMGKKKLNLVIFLIIASLSWIILKDWCIVA